ncbi:potassium transporter KefG [Pokkaliibacter plantistimulans]|uniref:Potassium transporter KefG n=1 Tax=Pokkaliibacter plantistimulans TaxID=1635171 RepID=A0ABX5LTW5_9GAMM|nr:NAD(P)H-dependent oxidoreductase [Pokkaliibacter plantistimulans]PXF30087.1 potassium transporter KefG [Pokkaliibacter plantistimulans]
MSNKVLLLFAHPSQRRSEVNLPMFRAAQQVEGVSCVDLYGEYPTFRIDVKKEQQRLLDHDVLIFQFPLYWYSTPSILKEWQDLVLEHGFAYGGKGTALRGKTFLCAVSAGAAQTAYQQDGYNHFTLRELLRPLEQTARLTGMHYLAPFALFGSRTAVEDQCLPVHIQHWTGFLRALVNNQIDIARAAQQEHIGDDWPALLLSAPAHQVG